MKTFLAITLFLAAITAYSEEPADPGQKTVDDTTLLKDNTLAKPAYDALIIPEFKKGTQVGMKVTKLVDGSSMSKLGFKENDIIESYNKKPTAGDPSLVSEMSREIDKGTCGPIRVRRTSGYVTLSCK